MKSTISQTLEKVRKYTPVPGGYHSDSARKASTRNFHIRALKHSLNTLVNLKTTNVLIDSTEETIQELIFATVDIINELILIGNPTIRRKLMTEGKKAWADGRRVWTFGAYSCLQSFRYRTVAEAQEVEAEANSIKSRMEKK